MYLEHFKLKEFPFLSSPDWGCLYLADQVNETFKMCLYMLSNRNGPVYTSGPIGAGKTTLSSRLQQQLEQEKNKYIVSYLVIPPQLTVNSLLRMIIEEFGFKTDRSYARSLEYMATWLREQHNGLVYSLIGHRFGYSNAEEVSRCIHKNYP